jgi:hypothetical protein
MCCLRCGQQHLPIWPCDRDLRAAHLRNSFAFDCAAATAAETLNIQRYHEWRDGGQNRPPGEPRPGERT